MKYNLYSGEEIPHRNLKKTSRERRALMPFGLKQNRHVGRQYKNYQAKANLNIQFKTAGGGRFEQNKLVRVRICLTIELHAKHC